MLHATSPLKATKAYRVAIKTLNVTADTIYPANKTLTDTSLIYVPIYF